MLINKSVPINLKNNITYKIGKCCNNKGIVFKNFDDQIKKCKSQIDDLENIHDWDKAKKFLNPYELIHITSNSQRKHSIAEYNPISRSFFKMIEMIYEFNLCSNQNPINVSNLAEGPGGFMEAILYYRQNSKDVIKGITLKSNKKTVPNWEKVSYIFTKYKNIDTYYGNLYYIKTINKYKKTFNNKKVELITADAGFDYSQNFNSQEVLSHRIIFSEIIAALLLQKKDGTFICKIFDTFHILTLKFIYLIYCFYDEVYLYKPNTSRKANSEKYIIAKKFKGVDPDILENLVNIHKDWQLKINNDETIIDFINLKLPNEFIRIMSDYNELFIENQMKYIDNTLELTKTYDQNLINSLVNDQISRAVNWCNYYDININNNSKYLKYYYNVKDI
jgi:23S rRNA U2552 (ribose-2'-O)-methylase RlmE/FtsJ